MKRNLLNLWFGRGDPVPKQKTVSLQSSRGGLEIPGTLGIVLRSAPDYKNYTNADYEEDDAFWVDLYTALMEGYRTLIKFGTHAKKPKKGCEDAAPEFWPSERMTRARAYLATCPPELRWHEREIFRGKPIRENLWRHLLVCTERADRMLAEIEYLEGEPEAWFFIFEKNQEACSADELFRVPAPERPVPALTIEMEYFFLRPELYPVSQFIERVRAVSQAHERRMEVNLI